MAAEILDEENPNWVYFEQHKERFVPKMKGRLPFLFSLLAGFLALTGLAFGQSADFLPLNMVKPGQKGVGKTVFYGTQVETFDVEILGVLQNVGPQQNLILARLSGKPLEETGVFAGMSGSPVYVDGKLVGAVAYAFSFAKQPIAGITPIQEIVDIFRENLPKNLRLARRSSPARLMEVASLPDLFSSFPFPPEIPLPAAGLETSGSLRPIGTPISFAGFAPQSIQAFAPHLQALGLVPVVGAASGRVDTFKDVPLEAGSTITVQLVRGDMDVSAAGTVTHISGDKIYAFGHPFLSIGYTDLPMNRAAVLAIIPSLMSSMKISAPTGFAGSVRQDRATGIMALRGEKSRLIPVRLTLHTSRHESKIFNYEVVTDNFLTPLLMTFTVHNSILSSERAIGGQTLQVKCKISLQGQPEVNFENSVSDLFSTPAVAALAAASPVNFIMNSGFDNVVMEGIELEITAVEQTREAVLEKVWLDRLEVKAGEEVNLTVFLRKPNGETLAEKYPVKIPEEVQPGALKIMIGDGLSLTKAEAEMEPAEFVPQDLSQLVKAINNLKKNDRLYIRLFRNRQGAVVGGEGLPALPPSMLALYGSEKTSGDSTAINQVVFSEHELPATGFVLKGRTTLTVNVTS